MTEPTEPLNYDQLYPGRFMKAGQFLGKKPTLTIQRLMHEELADPNDITGETKKLKVIVSFVETPFQLVMCKTNSICLREMFGKHLPDWKGKRVTLFAGVWKGKEAIRVWGSPDIPEDTRITIKLVRHRPFDMVMHKTAPKSAAGPQSPDPPAADAPEQNSA